MCSYHYPDYSFKYRKKTSIYSTSALIVLGTYEYFFYKKRILEINMKRDIQTYKYIYIYMFIYMYVYID